MNLVYNEDSKNATLRLERYAVWKFTASQGSAGPPLGLVNMRQKIYISFCTSEVLIDTIWGTLEKKSINLSQNPPSAAAFSIWKCTEFAKYQVL